MMELTHENIWQVLDHLRDFCASRGHCDGCFYSDTASTIEGEVVTYCAIRRLPESWQTDIVKMHVEAEEEGGNE